MAAVVAVREKYNTEITALPPISDIAASAYEYVLTSDTDKVLLFMATGRDLHG